MLGRCRMGPPDKPWPDRCAQPAAQDRDACGSRRPRRSPKHGVGPDGDVIITRARQARWTASNQNKTEEAIRARRRRKPSPVPSATTPQGRMTPGWTMTRGRPLQPLQRRQRQGRGDIQAEIERQAHQAIKARQDLPHRGGNPRGEGRMRPSTSRKGAGSAQFKASLLPYDPTR